MIQPLAFIIISVALLCLGLFLWRHSKRNTTRYYKQVVSQPTRSGVPQVCPVCSATLSAGERIRSTIYPPKGGFRAMHILGCVSCLAGERARVCPVCGKTLSLHEPLIARVFERPGRTHVHVLGCTRCHAAPPK